jgi:hypothetical protein
MGTSRKAKLRRGTDDILVPAWGQGVENDARAALDGARYHLDQIRTLWDAGFPDSLTNPFHFHLRCFFWELYAARDCLEDGGRNTPRLCEAARALWDAQWFKEVAAYRNFAHRSFHVVEVVAPTSGGRPLGFQLQRALRSQAGTLINIEPLERYGRLMHDFLRQTFSEYRQ